MKPNKKVSKADIEAFMTDIQYLVEGMVDCVRVGDDGFLDAQENLAEEIKDRCQQLRQSLHPEPEQTEEHCELDPNDPRMVFRRFLGIQVQKLPSEVLYGPDHEIGIHLETIALERRDLKLLYCSHYNTFHQELDKKIEVLLPLVRERYRQPELFTTTSAKQMT